MTKQENFKLRVRARMEKTGERYAAARAALIAQTPSGRTRTWVSEPEFDNDAVTAATGHGWEHWCDLIDAGPGRHAGHPTIATFLREEHDVGPWWAQGVTVGYERIVGLRLPFQRADGTFTANKSKTIAVDAAELRRMLLDDAERAEVLPNIDTKLRSKPSSKAIRLGIEPGYALIVIEPNELGRAKVIIAHEQLPTFDEVDEWKFFWNDWLEALDQG